MIHLNWSVIIISILYISTNAESDNNSHLLPQSIVEIKQYYDFIINLEKRGVINRETADKEKELYIQHESKLVGKKELFIDVSATHNQRQSIVSSSNITQILAGIIVLISFIVFIDVYIPESRKYPRIGFEILYYIISIYLMMLSSRSWLVLLGCFIFIVMLPTTISIHSINLTDFYLTISRIYFIVWTIVAIYQQNQLVGYLAIAALQLFLSTQKFMRQLIIIIGFQFNETLIPNATIGSFILILIGSILHIQQRPNFLIIPFTRPLLFLGTFVYFIGMFILTSRLYTEWHTKKNIFWLLQFIAFLSGLAAIFFGPMFELPFVQAIGGTMFVIWLLQKYVEITPWNTPATVIVSLLGLEFFLYGLSYFFK
jgi:hypothetical protein